MALRCILFRPLYLLDTIKIYGRKGQKTHEQLSYTFPFAGMRFDIFFFFFFQKDLGLHFSKSCVHVY